MEYRGGFEVQGRHVGYRRGMWVQGEECRIQRWQVGAGGGVKCVARVLTLIKDIHARLVCADGFQDSGVQGGDLSNAPVVAQEFLHCLRFRDALGLDQPVLDAHVRGPVKSGMVDLCEGHHVT